MFGLGSMREKRRKHIDDFLHTFEDTTDAITARLLLRQVYMEAYDIVNHGETLTARHLSALSDKENTARGSALETVFHRYLFYDVLKYTGHNFSQFIDQTYWECEMQFRNIIEQRIRTEHSGASLEQKLNNLMNKGKP